MTQPIEHDVVWPARAQGYEQVWMVGVSMGGFGTLHYASMFPRSLDGIYALGRYDERIDYSRALTPALSDAETVCVRDLLKNRPPRPSRKGRNPS